MKALSLQGKSSPIRGWPLIIFSAGAITLSTAASTITSVSCTSPGAPYITNSASCYALGTEGYAQGGVTASVSMPASASAAVVISADSTASALETTIRSVSATATGTSSADIGVTFGTAGLVRDGLLELSFNQLVWTPPANGYMYETLSVASYGVSPAGSSLNVWIPIQLGTNFDFDYQQSLIAISSGLTTGEIDSQISLLAFEANGVTPVQLLDPPGPLTAATLTPEPGSFGMMLVAGIAGFMVIRKKQWR